VKDVHAASATEVQDEIRAIRQSGLFAHSNRRIELLEYLCTMVLAGRHDDIKESTIALEVFDRTSDFDDKKDAIVRVEAYRLRQRLAKYYATEGAHDRVVIELLPGGYIPRFFVREPKEPQARNPEPLLPAAPAAPPLSRWWRPGWKIAVAASVAAAFALGLAISPSRRILLPTPATALSAAAPAFLPPPALHPAADEIRILAGSSKSHVDRAGRFWSEDRFFHGGMAQPGPNDLAYRPPDPNLYRFMRYGEDFSYDIPETPGVYELRLHFAEPTFRNGTDVGSEGGENQRHFKVTLNGADLLSDFDVVADTGVSPVDVRAFRNISPAPDGSIHLRFTALMGPSFVNAIEIVPERRGRVLPIRIRAADTSFTDSTGRLWEPDDYYIGGRLAAHKGDVSGTPDPDLYAVERYGNFSYAIPVPPGRYALTLYFAETYWDPDGDASHKGGAGSRVFSVYCNGAALLEEFDILKLGKAFHGLSRTFHGLRPNGQGKLDISFSPVVNYAAVKAIEITEEPHPGD
jgi:Malectin domain